MKAKSEIKNAIFNKFRKGLFLTFDSIAFGAAAYLFGFAIWIMQTGGGY